MDSWRNASYSSSCWVVAASALLLSACANTPFGGANAAAAQTARPAATRYTVEKGAIENKIVATGKITPRGAASLVFPRSGTVVTITVKEGEAVKTGQPLGALDTSDLVLSAQSHTSITSARRHPIAKPSRVPTITMSSRPRPH